MRWTLYHILFAIGFTAMLPRFLYRMWRRGGYRRGFLQRLGWYDADTQARLRAKPRVWVHAVSVGEIYIADFLMKAWRRRRPEIAFAVTTTTSTAHAIGRKILHADDVLLYFPVDVPIVARRVLDLIQPRALVLTECELWPTVIREARARGVPVALVNGRISERSYRGYRKVRFFFRPVAQAMNVLCVQGRGDAERLISLGAPPDRVRVLGTAKYDVAQPDAAGEAKVAGVLAAAGIDQGRPILVGGSTWAGEEDVLLDYIAARRGQAGAPALVLVPRHVERSEEVLAAARARGVRVVRRSELTRGAPAIDGHPDVLLVDTTGELKSFYSAASAIFVGKSLTQHGGQNVIEPALYGKPVIVGPNMENFADVMADFLSAGGLVQVPDAAGVHAAIDRMMQDAAWRADVGRRARGVVESHRGAVEATLDLVDPLVLRSDRPAAAR